MEGGRVMAEVDSTAMEVAAEETVRTSASVSALGGQAPTGVGPPLPLRASLPGDGHHGSHDVPRSSLTTQPMPSQAQPPPRRDSQQVEVQRTPAKGGGNAVPTSVGPSPHGDRAPHNNPSPNAHRPPHSQQPPEQQAVEAHPTAAHPNIIRPRHSPGSSQNPTAAPVQRVASTTDATSVDSLAVQGNARANFEEQQRKDVVARPARGRPRKTPAQRQVDFPTGLSPIPSERRVAPGVGPSGTSAMQPINVEQYEEQRKRRIADRLQEDDRMYEQFRQERARLIAESETRLVEVR